MKFGTEIVKTMVRIKSIFIQKKLHCRYGQDQIIIINNHFTEMGEVGNCYLTKLILCCITR